MEILVEGGFELWTNEGPVGIWDFVSILIRKNPEISLLLWPFRR